MLFPEKYRARASSHKKNLTMSKQYPEPKQANRWEFYRALAMAEQEPVLKKQRQEFKECMAARQSVLEKYERETEKIREGLQEIKKQADCVQKKLDDIPVLPELEDSEIVTATLFKCERQATDRGLQIKKCTFVYHVRARDGHLKTHSSNECVVCPKCTVPDGEYYIFAVECDCLINIIYNHEEDASVYYRTENEFSFGGECCYCHGTFFTTWIFFRFPGLGKRHAGAHNDGAGAYICASCINKKTDGFDDLIKSTQKYYNSRMYYPAVLTQLLYAHTRLEDNPFHADNLPRDVFKLILRAVFPPAFLLIK